MNFNWKKIDKVGGFIVGIGFLLFFVFYALNQEIQLAYFSKYTIAEVTDKYNTGHLVETVTFKYVVGGKEYKRGANKLREDVEVGKRYYVKFSYLNPVHSNLLQDKPVPYNIKQAPPEGWEELPDSEEPPKMKAKEFNKLLEQNSNAEATMKK